MSTTGVRAWQDAFLYLETPPAESFIAITIAQHWPSQNVHT